MKTEDIIERLQLRCADGGFNDYLLVNALCRLRTLQSIGEQKDRLIEILERKVILLEASKQAIAKGEE